MEDSNAKIVALKYVRQECNMLLLDAKRAIEAYVAEHQCSYAEAGVAVAKAHQHTLSVDVECKRIAETRAAEALRVTAGYTIAELQAMPDHALGRALRVVNAVRNLIRGPGTIAAVRAAGDAWIASLEEC